jgi:hypothetical protein
MDVETESQEDRVEEPNEYLTVVPSEESECDRGLFSSVLVLGRNLVASDLRVST